MKALFLPVLAVFALAGPALAADPTIHIDHGAYAYQTAPQQKNGAVFLSFHNIGTTDYALVSASSPVAEHVEIHTMSMAGDVMEMRKLDSLPLPAGETVTLEPAGDHIMLIGLHEPLAVDRLFPLTLVLDDDTQLDTMVQVVTPGAQATPSDHDMTTQHGDADHSHH